MPNCGDVEQINVIVNKSPAQKMRETSPTLPWETPCQLPSTLKDMEESNFERD